MCLLSPKMPSTPVQKPKPEPKKIRLKKPTESTSESTARRTGMKRLQIPMSGNTKSGLGI